MKALPPLKVSLHGMNSRMQSMIKAYLQLNCQSVAYVVKEFDADAEIVDLDSEPSENILDERLKQQPSKPIIAISLYDLSSDEAIHVKKPVKADDLVDAIHRAREKIASANVALKQYAPAKPFSSSTVEPSEEIFQSNKQGKEVETKKVELVSVKPTRKTSAFTGSNKVVELKEREKVSRPKNDWKKIEKNTIKETAPVSNSAFSAPYLEEIDRFLKELNHKPRKKPLKPSFVADTRRVAVRYLMFQQIKGQVVNSVFGVSQNFSVGVQVISSKGALVESNKVLKPKKKVTLKIKFDSEHVFNIQAVVVRKEGAKTYGLAFTEFHHEVTEYLISSGHSFDILDDAYAG